MVEHVRVVNRRRNRPILRMLLVRGRRRWLVQRRMAHDHPGTGGSLDGVGALRRGATVRQVRSVRSWTVGSGGRRRRRRWRRVRFRAGVLHGQRLRLLLSGWVGWRFAPSAGGVICGDVVRDGGDAVLAVLAEPEHVTDAAEQAVLFRAVFGAVLAVVQGGLERTSAGDETAGVNFGGGVLEEPVLFGF